MPRSKTRPTCDESVTTGFDLSCLGFFGSRLLRFWLLAIIVPSILADARRSSSALTPSFKTMFCDDALVSFLLASDAIFARATLGWESSHDYEGLRARERPARPYAKLDGLPDLETMIGHSGTIPLFVMSRIRLSRPVRSGDPSQAPFQVPAY
jgi:hypothetical protein